jgi:MFS transporter, DHA2 family, multidrug resistance protein
MQKIASYKLLSDKERVLATIALCLATFMFVLDYTIANVAVPYIAGSLGTSADEGTYVITFFAVGNALGIPLTGWLSKRFAMINTLVWAILLFTFFSICCGLSQSLLQIIVFRFLQGITAGPIVPLSQNCISMIFSREKIGLAMAIFSMIVLTAPVFGPIIGGLICIDYSWPWIFFINIPFGIFCVVVIRAVLDPFETKSEDVKLDKFGFITLFVGSTCLQILLDKGQEWDWLNSALVQTLIVLTLISFYYLYINCCLKKEPLLKLGLWRTPSYALSVVAIFWIYGLYIASVVIVPFWLQIYMGYDAYLAGLAVSPIGIIPVVFSIFIPKLLERIGCLLTMVIGVIGMAVASFFTMHFTSNVGIDHIALSRLLVGCGLVFWIPPIFKLAMIEMETKELPMALGMLHYVRAISGGIGTSVAMTLFKRRTIYHHANLVTSFTNTHTAGQEFMEKIHNMGSSQVQTDMVVSEIIDKQAAMLAFNDIFYCMGWAFVFVVAVLLLNYKKLGHFR